MGALDRIDKRELKELLSLGWMTHDGMWFYHCFQEYGIEAASRLNRAAIQSLAPLEMRRIKRTLGIEGDISTAKQLQEFIVDATELIIPEFMKVTFSFPAENVFQWEWEKDNCFAYVGLKRIGALEGYECGVIYRLACWFDSLGLSYTVDPPIKGCYMHTEGSCTGAFTFHL
jgi:hypothetical protein